VEKSKYGVTGDPIFTGYVTQPNIGPKIGSTAMLCKLTLIVIVASGKLYSEQANLGQGIQI